jgi:hypothetical protein
MNQAPTPSHAPGLISPLCDPMSPYYFGIYFYSTFLPPLLQSVSLSLSSSPPLFISPSISDSSL